MRRTLSVGIAVLTIALVVVAAPASAGQATDSDLKSDKAAAIAPFDFPEVDHAVTLQCRGAVTDRGPVVSCGWRADEHLEIAGWQLWRLQIRDAGDGRTLVAELGADVTSYIDTGVSAPAAYLYVVVGLDRAGEIVARSRPDLARVAEHPSAGIELVCHLQRAASDTAVVTGSSDLVEPWFEPAIACRWDRSDHADVRGYVVHRVVDGGRRTVIAEVGADTTSIVDHDIAFGHRYTYLVSALDHEGNVVAHSRAVKVGVPPWPHDRVTDRETDRIPTRPTDEVTDRPTDRPGNEVIDRPTDRPGDEVIDRPTDRPGDKATESDSGLDSAPGSAPESDMKETDHDRVVDAIADRASDLERPADRLPTDH
jgi:hypothetical protein